MATARNPASIPSPVSQHPNALTLVLDVIQESHAHTAARAAIDRFGRIDVLVNNAGYYLVGAVEEASGAEVDAVFRTNVFGLLNVSRAVLPYMRAQRSGRVINLSPVAGCAASAGLGINCATKFAVEGISEAMSLELEPMAYSPQLWNRATSEQSSWAKLPSRTPRHR